MFKETYFVEHPEMAAIGSANRKNFRKKATKVCISKKMLKNKQ